MIRSFESRSSSPAIEAYPEKANLFPLSLQPFPRKIYIVRGEIEGKIQEDVYLTKVGGATAVDPSVGIVRRALQRAILSALGRSGYRVRDKFPLVINTEKNYAPASDSLQIFPAFTLQVKYFGSNYFLCLDHKLVVGSSLSLSSLFEADESFCLTPSQRVLFKVEDEWEEGRVIDSGPEACQVSLPNGDTAMVLNEYLTPELTRTQIARLSPLLGMDAQDLERSIKQLSYLTIDNAARARLDSCIHFATVLASTAFPIIGGDTTVHLDATPASLRPPNFVLGKDLVEAQVAFDHVDQSKITRNIFHGLVNFGTYEKASSSKMRLAVVCPNNRIPMMTNLVNRMNKGAINYQGAQRTFGSEFVIREWLKCDSEADYDARLRQFVRSNVRDEIDVALVYLERTGNTNDPRHPYFRVKSLLLREGIASQMVDKATAFDPHMRELNLGLNVYAKSGYTPWVVNEAIEGVDLFIGLSWSQVQQQGRITRMMGYVNVFDAYGRWQFYQGDSDAFAFDDRLRHFGELVKNSIAGYRAKNSGNLKSVHIHLTKKFSAIEREVLANAVRAEAPEASVVFVWINTHHNLRLYNLSEDGDGQVDRTTYLRDDPGRIYLATTGNNAFKQKGMGTPIPLELTVWADPADALPNLRDVGQQVLSLTRLNWASSRNFCHEPITTKYAGDIARLMTAFMEDPTFFVNPSLRGIPWFL